ncbi:MAG: cytochrome c [Terriglobales bacterium]
MLPKTRSLVLSIGLAALLASCAHRSTSKEQDHGIANGKMESMLHPRSDNPVHTIVLPHDEPVFPPSAGRDEFITACVVCHSPRYITMQPRFSRTTWLSEVKKMKDVYGAHISDDQVLKITNYVVSINGKAGTGQGSKGTYGE